MYLYYEVKRKDKEEGGEGRAEGNGTKRVEKKKRGERKKSARMRKKEGKGGTQEEETGKEQKPFAKKLPVFISA